MWAMIKRLILNDKLPGRTGDGRAVTLGRYNEESCETAVLRLLGNGRGVGTDSGIGTRGR